MRETKLFILTTTSCTLYNKGVRSGSLSVASIADKVREACLKRNEEKMLNYLVVPNNFVLSLSLSLSLSLIEL